MSGEEQELKEKISRQLLRKYGNTDRESMQKLFNEYDTDRRGTISPTELEKLLKDADVGNGLTRGAWVRGIIKKLDSGKDGAIDWREFTAALG